MLRIAPLRRLLLLPALLLLLAPVAGLAQPPVAPAESPVDERAAQPPVAPAAPAPPALSQLDQRLALPLLQAGPSVSVVVGTGYDSTTGEVTGAATSFAYGVEQLFVQTTVAGGDGLVLRQSFTFADGETLGGSPRTVIGDAPFVRTSSYCITTASTCQSGRLLLERGTYTAQVYLNELPAGTFSVMIQ